jgi:alcohol dehydrogenase class IV
MSDLVGNWNYPTKVWFGAGRAKEIGAALETAGISKPLIVTDPGLAALPMIGALKKACDDAKRPAAVFSDVMGNPVGKNVDDGLAVYTSGGHDGVVAVGGGSALDVGKAIALMAGQDRPLWDFEDVGDNWTRVNEAGVAPTIAIPTTAGTGSEVGRSSVITHEDEQRKVIIFHPLMLPVLAICDPEVTVSLPKRLTAATGMDALSHNLEAYCANGYHPLGDGIAVEGIRLVKEYLERATNTPNDLEARGQMLSASLMGATAFQKGLGAMHALSHPIGVHLKQHHGEINAVVMPYVLAYNFTYIEERLDRLAKYMGLDNPTAQGFVDWTVNLKARLGIPMTVAELTMTEDHIEQFAGMAEHDPAGFGNPIKMTAARYAELYRYALKGELPPAATR